MLLICIILKNTLRFASHETSHRFINYVQLIFFTERFSQAKLRYMAITANIKLYAKL